MNKVLFRLIGVIAVAIYSVSAYAETFEVDGIYYKTDYKDKTTAVVTSGTNKYSGEVVIPETVEYKGNTLRVTTIGSSAFANSTDLTSVKLPNTITSIEIQAFRGCTGITNISIPNSVISMGTSVFSGCSSLASFEWSSALHVIPSGTFNYCSSLLAVQIPNHILRIGDNAFANCKKLQDITIGSSVTEIGKQVFQSCEKLESIDIPSSVKTIGFWAFRSSAIKTVTIPSNVVSIGEGCFSACHSLETIELSEGLDTIGNKCFDGCNLTSINIPSSVRHIGVNPFVSCDRLERISVTANSRNYCSVDGVLYSVDKDTLLAFPKAKGKEYVCQTETKVIAPYAFYSSNISHIILNEGLVSIEEGVFNSNSDLNSITFPSTLTVIGKKAFDYTNLNGIISKIQNPVDVLIDAFSQEIYEKTTLYIPKGTMSLYLEKNGWKEFKKIKESGLYESDGLKYEIDFNTNTAILLGPVDENYDVFDFNEDNNYDDIEFDDRIVVPDSIPYQGKSIPVVKIVENAFFEHFLFISSLTLSRNIKEIGDNAFYGCCIDTVIVRNPTPISIAENVFNDVYDNSILIVPQKTKSAYSATLPWSKFSSIKEIDGEIDIDGLLYEIDFNNSTATLLMKSSSASYKETIEIPETISYQGYPIYVVGIAKDAFKGAWIESVTLSKNIQTIGSSAFCGCSLLKTVTAMMEVPITIEENVFEGVYGKATLIVPQKKKSIYSTTLPWSKFSIIKERDSDVVVDGLLYEIDFNSNTATLIKKNSFVYSSDEIEIPETITYNDQQISVTGIAKDAFKSTNLKSIAFSKNISVIGNNAFSGCSNLKKIVVRNETPIAINENVFEGIYDKATLFVPQGFLPQYQQAEVWKKFTNIQEEQYGDIETEGGFRVGGIYYEIDSGTPTNVRVVKNPDGYKGTITIPSQVTFKEKIYNVKELGSYAFSNCTQLTTIILSEGLAKIETGAFYNCISLKSIELPSSLQEIEDRAFSNCDIIKEIYIPKSVVKIGTGILSGCNALENIRVEEGNPNYSSGEEINAIIEIETKTLIAGCGTTHSIPESVEYIGEYAFNNNNGVVNIFLPKSIVSVGTYAFSNCTKLSTIILSEGLAKIETGAFYNCISLKSIELPSSLQEIEDRAFSSCNKLSEIVSKIDTPFVISEKVFYEYNNIIYNNAILFVPIGKVEAYRDTAGWNKFVHIQEIEPDPTPIIDDKTYVIHKRTGQADLQSVVSGDHIAVPETIEYEGKNYSVTRILDSTFTESNMISLSIPKSITYVGIDVIKDCYQLAAIVWHPAFKPTTEFVSHIANPNLLFYVTEEQYKSDGIRNVIVGEQANSISLTDETYGNFYCPKAFTAGNITYTHYYSLPTEKGLAQGWETIALPFDVTTIKTASGDVIKPISIAETGEKRFWLRELTGSGFADVSSIKANTPYIISMPNWDGYQDFYNITGNVTFSAQNVTVQTSDNLQISTSGSYKFTPNYQSKEQNGDYYVLNITEIVDNGTTYAPGSVFKPGLRAVRPFEAYLTASGSAAARRCISIADLMGGATAIADIPVNGERIYSDNGVVYIESAAAGSCHIYSISGRLLRRLALKMGTNRVEGLTKGVYVVNGQKVLVR